MDEDDALLEAAIQDMQIKRTENVAEEKLTKAQLKRLKQKQKKLEQIDDPPIQESRVNQDNENKIDGKTEEKSKKGKKKGKEKEKISSLAKRIKEEQQKFKELEEQKRKEEEERIRIIEEQIKIQEEKKKQKEEEAKKRTEDKKNKIEELKRQGKWQSKTERNKNQKAQLMLEAMMNKGLVSIGQGNTGSSGCRRKKKDKNIQNQNPSSISSVPKTNETEDNDQIKPKEPEKFNNNITSLDSPNSLSPSPSITPPIVSTPPPSSIIVSEPKKEKSKEKRKEYRSPICCFLGHVDTGKTSLLDKIRHSTIQNHEAGGITQQIGATYFPMDMLKQQTSQLPNIDVSHCNFPGLLVIDTPGHASFTNLRSRGSSLCDIAVLIIDIMHGVEPQTVESLELLKRRKCPFVVALNKIDRIYHWKSTPFNPFLSSFEEQGEEQKNEFNSRVNQIINELAKFSFNCSLYYKNPDYRSYVSLIPTSAVTGEGIPDLFGLLIKLTTQHMDKKLQFITELQCTVLEVKKEEGHGTTLDVILSNGVLHEGDVIVLCGKYLPCISLISLGLNGPIVTSIRALLAPPPLKEIRSKQIDYIHMKNVTARFFSLMTIISYFISAGVKIAAQNLENTISGSNLYVYDNKNPQSPNLEDLKDLVMSDLASILSRVDKSGEGVSVQSSTLGALEALLQFLTDSKIPVNNISIGTVMKKDVMKASVMLEHRKEYATILAFDVKISADATLLSQQLGVKIIKADIIYHLFDQWTNYINEIKEARRQAASTEAVFPCIIHIIPDCVFHNKNPIVMGVEVKEGIIKLGTPLIVPNRNNLEIGRVVGIQREKKDLDRALKGEKEICIKIEAFQFDTQVLFGRHFQYGDVICSHLTRKSIDLLKENFRDDLSEEEWKLVIKLKKILNIT